MVYISSQARVVGNRIFLIAQIFAVFPLRLKHDGLFLDPVLLAYAMILKLTVGIYILYLEVYTRLFTSSLVAYFTVITHFIIILFKKDKLNDFLKLLSDCEFSFLQLGKKSLIKRSNVIDFLLIAISASSTLVDDALHQSLNSNSFFKMLLRLCVFGVVHPFFHLVLIMQDMFLTLNEILQETSDIKHLRLLTEIHQRCVIACHILNDCFTHQILLITGSLFFYMTVISYSVFILIEADAGFFAVTIKAVSLLYTIFMSYLGCKVCEETSTQAKKFDILLHRLMIVDVSGELVNDEKLYLHIAMKQEICFSASNVFAVDFNLIHSMVSAATTYLVILIQLNG